MAAPEAGSGGRSVEHWGPRRGPVRRDGGRQDKPHARLGHWNAEMASLRGALWNSMMATGMCQMQKGGPRLVNGARVYFSGEKLMSLEQGLAMHTMLTERAPSARAAVVVASHTLSTPARPTPGMGACLADLQAKIALSPWPGQEQATCRRPLVGASCQLQ
jgi:hypothetical protein